MIDTSCLFDGLSEFAYEQEVLQVEVAVRGWEIACTVLTLLVLVVAVYIAHQSGRVSKQMQQYTYLANKWYDIREMEFRNPDFIDTQKTHNYKTAFSGETLLRYNIFARICWGHGEDVYRNGWHKDPGFAPTLKGYKSLHHIWLKEPENLKFFELNFVKYIEELEIE